MTSSTRKRPRRWISFIQYAMAAAQLALEDSGLVIDEENAERVGVVVGSGLGGLPAIERYHDGDDGGRLSQDQRRFSSRCRSSTWRRGRFPSSTGAKGPNLSPVSACATGTHSIGDAFHMIQRGDADAMIAGGSESTVVSAGYRRFCRHEGTVRRAMTTRRRPVAPFEKNRDGFVLAEGAGIVVLEEYEGAKTAWCQNLWRGGRLWPDRRCLPSDRSGAGRRRGGPLHEDGPEHCRGQPRSRSITSTPTAPRPISTTSMKPWRSRRFSVIMPAS